MKRLGQIVAVAVLLFSSANSFAVTATSTQNGSAVTGKILGVRCIATYPVCRIVIERNISGPNCTSNEMGIENTPETRPVIAMLVAAKLSGAPVTVWADPTQCWRASLPQVREVQL